MLDGSNENNYQWFILSSSISQGLKMYLLQVGIQIVSVKKMNEIYFGSIEPLINMSSEVMFFYC